MIQGLLQVLKACRSLVAKRQLKLIDAGKKGVIVNILNAICMLIKSWDTRTLGAIVNCFRKAGISNGTQTASVEYLDDSFKLFAEDLEELGLRGVVEKNVDMDDYVDVDFDVSVTKSSSITDIKILATVSNVEEQDDMKDKELNVQDGEKLCCIECPRSWAKHRYRRSSNKHKKNFF